MENSYIDYNHKSIQMKNITKKFGDFVANDNINLTQNFYKYAGNEIKADGENYIILRQSDILAIVEL